MSSLRLLTGIVLVALTCLAPCTGLRAEVAVSFQQSSVGLYSTQPIVDDPDPIGLAWTRYSADTSIKFVLNDQGDANGDGRPSLLYNTFSTLPIVAWSRNSPGGYDVVLSRFDGGAWTMPTVLADSTADELDPVLVMDPSDGSVHLLYWVAGASPVVMYRSAPADLSTWSPAIEISQPGELAVRPAAVFFEGQLHAAYENHSFGFGTTPREIVLATDDGAGFSSMLLATTYHAGANWPEVHRASGRIWVEWIDAEDEMNWTRKLLSGSWESLQTEPYDTSEKRDYHVRGTIRSQALQP